MSLLAASQDDSAPVGSLMWDLRDKSAKKSGWLLVGRELHVTKRIFVIRVSMEICHEHGLGIIFILQQMVLLWCFALC